ncbi:MAG: hypothetical protein V4658_04625 [Bacteroidota bacterium]
MRIFLFILLTVILHATYSQPEKGLIAQSSSTENFTPDSNTYYLPAYKHVSIYSRPDIRSKIFHKTGSFPIH